jgi:hypothetical protein
VRIVHVRPLSGAWPIFIAGPHDPDLGWTAECADLGVVARGATWAELLANCVRGIDALLGPDEEALTVLGYAVDGYSTAMGLGTHYDVMFEVRQTD